MKRMPMVTLDLWMDRPDTFYHDFDRKIWIRYRQRFADIDIDIDRYDGFSVSGFHVETCQGQVSI